MDVSPPQETTQDILQKNLKPETVIEYKMSEKEASKGKNAVKDALLKFNGASIDISGGLEPGNGLKYDAQLAGGLSVGKVLDLETWNESGVFGKLFSETQAHLAPNLPVHPVGEIDISVGDKPVFRGGVSTKWIKMPIKGLELKTEFYPLSNVKDENGNTEKYLWVKAKCDLRNGWSAFGMTKQFTSKTKHGRNQVYGVSVSKDLKNGWYLKGSYWRTPDKRQRYQMGFGKKF
ncbi:MAG: hypothetical protein KAS04_02200 [Candidatus Aenigmarchaeota archaeon]|nr:hypothetical protein [Candidatus Aenigmarchaeota archaeon]